MLTQLTQRLSGLDLSAWSVWFVPVIGAVSAGLTFVVGRAVYNWRRPRPAAPVLTAKFDSSPHGDSERRTFLRRNSTLIGVSITDAEAKVTPTHGLILDRSIGGVCLQMDVSVAVGTFLNIRPRDATAVIPWTRVEVRSCRPHDGTTWEVGCQFVRTPPWSVLLLFG